MASCNPTGRFLEGWILAGFGKVDTGTLVSGGLEEWPVLSSLADKHEQAVLISLFRS